MCLSKSILYIAILSVCGFCSYPILVSTGSFPEKTTGPDCRKALENQGDSEHTKSIVRECLDSFPFKDPNDSTSIEESQRILEENQNNCALKCINENLNVTKDDGLIDVSKIQQHFLNTTVVYSSSYVLKLTSLMLDCERKAVEELQQTEGGLEQNACKYHTLFMHCYSDAYIASREELHKLCQESSKQEHA